MIRVISDVKSTIKRLKRYEKGIQKSLNRGLSKWVLMAHKSARRLLSGSGKSAAGAYPVPVRTGQLRRAQDYILPGKSKHGITARQGDAYLVNTVRYAAAIHKKRPFAQDGINQTRSEGMRAISLELRKGLMAGISI